MLCYVMLCYVMLCYVMLCYVIHLARPARKGKFDPLLRQKNTYVSYKNHVNVSTY